MAANLLRGRLATTCTPFPLSRSLTSSSSYSSSDIESIFHIINNPKSSPSQTLTKTLKSTNIHLTNSLIDQVLKRVRFSHSDPLRTLEFFNYASNLKGFYHTPFSLDTMLYILGRGRRFDKIWEVLGEMKRKDRGLVSERTVGVVLGRIAKVCSVRMTVEGFRRFRRIVPEFGTSCFNALLRVLCQEKSMADARNVYHGLKGQFRPDLMTFNVLLSGWKSTEEAEGFWEEMKEMGVEPDIVSYNCLVDVYCKNSEVEKAYKVMDEIVEKGLAPDVITYTSLIGGLGLVGRPDKAREVLREMKEAGCYPDVAAYNAAIRNFCIAKRLGDAYQLMDEMVEKGLQPNAVTYNLFFRVFYWANDLKNAWDLYMRMKVAGCLSNTQSCMFLIRLAKRQEKVDMALELWNDMVEKGFGSYVLVSDVLIDLLCDMGKLVEAEKCFLQMVDKGQKPSSVSFKRIKVLMELANQHDALKNLSEKMGIFGSSVEVRDEDDLLVDTTRSVSLSPPRPSRTPPWRRRRVLS